VSDPALVVGTWVFPFTVLAEIELAFAGRCRCSLLTFLLVGWLVVVFVDTIENTLFLCLFGDSKESFYGLVRGVADVIFN
jgi:hypothetical protein